MTISTTPMGYRATRDSRGALTVHSVSIFVECFRAPNSEDSEFDGHYDSKWIGEAVAKAQQAAQEGYYPPLHIRHHEPSTDLNDSVRPAGHFRITGTQTITFKGSRRIAVIADLVITDPKAQEEVMSDRLPYRSVEIFDVRKPAFDGLALLDHEAPFLELPMLMVSEVDGQPVRTRDVAGATTWSMSSVEGASPVLACFRRGERAHILMRDDDRMEDDEKTVAEEINDRTRSQGFASDGEKVDEKKPDAEMEGDGESKLDVAAVCKAIASGDISVKDMDEILAAIQSQHAEAEPTEESVAPAAAPGAESMKKGADETDQFAAMQGKIDAFEARGRDRDAREKRRDDVAEAMQQLEGIPLGADLEDRLVAFHKEHGPAAFKTYTETMATFGGAPRNADGKGAAFLGQQGAVPAVAMKYQEGGTDAVDKAAAFAREWEGYRDNGGRITQERYVELSMQRAEGALTH